MGERVEETAPSGLPERVPIPAPRLLDADRSDEAGLAVDAVPVDEVDRAGQVIPRIRSEEVARLLFPARNVVDLEAELYRQSLTLRLDDCLDIRLDRMPAALELVRH